VTNLVEFLKVLEYAFAQAGSRLQRFFPYLIAL